ncbi:TPA: hypothetical protein JD273_15780 [Proteus mirabilis]|nr:hypothetical protein [Proteus mirabilis]
MKGTTLRELINRYDLQAMALADRQHPIDSEYSMPFFRAHLKYRKKLMPRGQCDDQVNENPMRIH